MSGNTEVHAVNNLNELIDEVITKNLIRYYDYKDFHNIEKIGNNHFGEFEFRREVNFHKNIIQFVGITNKVIKYYTKQNNQFGQYLIIMEHTDSGSLQNYLRENFIKLTWEDKYRLAYQPVCGVSYLHNKEFEHLNLWLKCSDNLMQSYSLNKKSDVYSIGVILWEISSGQLPFKDETYDASLTMRIMQECWNNEPDERPTMNQVVAKLKDCSPQLDLENINTLIT
ncbi:kinase-like domain-containing protein [Rhizophagus clarus]|uniref:Kinase-like domain-containing protein n=1 Tax=Rhizophagus clarus TaxID=94130 RepID=A0A8H3QTQ2_9GLOM|nr:kinase-like domain-containing protein [Rhizophagus clarus]